MEVERVKVVAAESLVQCLERTSQFGKARPRVGFVGRILKSIGKRRNEVERLFRTA